MLIPHIYNSYSQDQTWYQDEEFRPISFYNVICKIIAKIFANRFKTIILSIISPNQSAFVPGRLLTNNIIIAYETLHYIITKCKGNNIFMALKLDMIKAYDRIE